MPLQSMMLRAAHASPFLFFSSGRATHQLRGPEGNSLCMQLQEQSKPHLQVGRGEVLNDGRILAHVPPLRFKRHARLEHGQLVGLLVAHVGVLLGNRLLLDLHALCTQTRPAQQSAVACARTCMSAPGGPPLRKRADASVVLLQRKPGEAMSRAPLEQVISRLHNWAGTDRI